VIADLAGREMPPIVLHHAVDGRQVVVAGLHGPDLITLRAERLGSVIAHARVDDYGVAVGVDDEVADVVVVVALGVVSALGREIESADGAFLPARGQDWMPPSQASRTNGGSYGEPPRQHQS